MGVAASLERWVAPLGLRGIYEVSSLGRVRRNGRVLKPTVDRYGYETLNLSVLGERRRIKIHRLVCEAFHGPPPTREYEVGHVDGSRSNNAAVNVRWVTRQENTDDKLRHGTHYVQPPKAAMPRGATHPHAKFSDAQIAAVKADRAAGYSFRRIAEKRGISPGHACRIVNGKARA